MDFETWLKMYEAEVKKQEAIISEGFKKQSEEN